MNISPVRITLQRLPRQPVGFILPAQLAINSGLDEHQICRIIPAHIHGLGRAFQIVPGAEATENSGNTIPSAAAGLETPDSHRIRNNQERFPPQGETEALR